MKKDTGKNNQLRRAEKFSFIPFLDPDRLTKLPITSIYVHRERILVENNSYEVMNSVYGTIGNKFRLYKGSNATARYSVLLAELDRHGGCHYRIYVNDDFFRWVEAFENVHSLSKSLDHLFES